MAVDSSVHLQIVRFPDETLDFENDRFWTVNVILNGKAGPKPVRIIDPLAPEEHAEYRWYLEQFASQEPFDTERAAKVANSIDHYASQLIHQLNLDALFQHLEPTSNRSLLIDVCDSPKGDEINGITIHSLLWELLEQPQLWTGRFAKVAVRRSIASTDISSSALQVNPGAEGQLVLNVLLVIARNAKINPAVYQDAEPFVALNVLLGIQRALEKDESSLRVNLHVVRPGTYEAFKQHLESTTRERGSGYYHLVHFDLHGRVAKRRMANGEKVQTAWLDFASAQHVGKPRPVPADEVATLLVASGINCAVLNACDSARADQGSHAHLAMTFLEKGLSNVLAMSYEFARSIVGPCFMTFYDAFICQRASFSTAAQDARASLMANAQRKARFGLEVEVKDWLIPVLYTSGQDEVVTLPNATISAPDSINNNRMMFNETTSSDSLIGRDYDTLRLEQTILQSTMVFVHGIAGVGKSAFINYALDIWQRTNLFRRQSFVDLQERLILDDLSGASILTQLCHDLDIPDWLIGSTVSSDAPVTMEEHEQPLDGTIIVIDGIDQVFSKVFTAGLQGMEAVVAYVLRRFSSTSLTQDQSHGVKIIAAAQQGQQWFEERCKSVSCEYFELGGLELPDALSFSDMVFRKNGVTWPKRTRRDTDFQVHIVGLLQRIPLAMTIALPKQKDQKDSMEETFRQLLVGTVKLNYQTIKGRADYVFIISIKEVFERFPEYQDELCSLADFWIEGPLLLSDYFRTVGSYAGIHHEYNHDKLILCFNEIGAWRVTKENDLEWLHPLFTLYLRERRRSHSFRGPPLWAKGIVKVTDFVVRNKRTEPYGSNAALKVEIPQHFVKSVAFRGNANMLVDAFMASAGPGLNAPESGQTMRTSFFNVLTAFDMVCREDSPIPTQLWPRDLFSFFLAPSRLILSKPEHELLTSYVASILELFQHKIGGFAVLPELRLFAFNVVIHLLTASICGGLYDARRTEELVTVGLAMVEASEAEYGPFQDTDLMFKGMIYRFQAVFLLLKGDEKGADSAWETMKAIDLEYFGPSAFEQGAPGAGMGPSMNPLQGMTGPMAKPAANFRQATASWVPVRHAAWPWLKEQVLQKDNKHAVDRLYMPGIESAFEDMVTTHKGVGWKGFDHWKHYFPPRNDVNSYIRQLEDPDSHLQMLEEALDRGDWKVAAQAHLELLRKALGRQKIDQAEFHLTQLTQILNEVGGDTSMTNQFKAGLRIAKIGLKLQQGIANVDALDCLELVTAMEECGVTDVAAAYRAQGVPEIFIQIILQGAERARRIQELASLIPWDITTDPALRTSET